MPTYDYECTKGHQFEVEQRITEDPLTRCKICRSKATRLISATTFILKGGGWYSDGYGSSKAGGTSNSSEKSSDSSSAKSSSDSSSATSSDSSSSSSSSSSGSSTDGSSQ